MSKPYGTTKGQLSTPATDSLSAPFTRSGSLSNVNHNLRTGSGFSKGGADIRTPATDGIKSANVKNTIPKP